MAKSSKKLQAIVLRRQGKSIKAITETLGVSKSSVSTWCREVVLTKEQITVLERSQSDGRRRGSLSGAKANQIKKLERMSFHLSEGKKDISTFDKQSFLAAGLGIYWGEGTKKGQLCFVNSDPDMVIFMLKWFQLLGVRKGDFIARVYINISHKERVMPVEAFWKKVLRLPKDQFRTTVLIRRLNVKRYENHEKYYGTLNIRIRNSTELKYKILGLIEALKYSTFSHMSA